MKTFKFHFSSMMIALLFISACSQEHQKNHSHAVPPTWYNSDEKALQNNAPASDSSDEDYENNSELNQNINNILTASSAALEEGDSEAQTLMASSFSPDLSPLESKPTPNTNKPKDWVPWRAEYFMTDLSLTGSGFIGLLAFKGTSTVRAYWRKQGPKSEHSVLNQDVETAQEEASTLEPVVLVNDLSTAEDMVKQLEPAVKAAVATGKIQDTPVLRKNLLKTAQEFQSLAIHIPSSTEELPWWVSRFRLDFAVDAAGRVEPVGLVGGEVRFRFEWHRIKRMSPEKKKMMIQLSERDQKLRKNLLEFITATAYDINDAFENHTRHGFRAHQIRMGIGMSVKGNIGLVKGSAGVVGQIYFTRAVERPKLYPIKQKSLSLALANSAPLLVIERNPSINTLKLAAKNNIMVETFNTDNDENNGFEEALFRLDREKFRKGLKKAAKIGGFFAKRASEAKVKSWKIYELRTAFDASISGGLDLVTLVGSATAQISMFNENF